MQHDVVGLMLPGWGTAERARVTKQRARALRNQLTTLVREIYDFGSKPKPEPIEGLEQVAPQVRELMREYLPFVQRVTELPAADFETNVYPDQVDQFAARYGQLREQAKTRLRLQGKGTRTVPPEAFQEETDPSFIDQFISAPGATLSAIGIGAVLLLVFLWGRK